VKNNLENVIKASLGIVLAAGITLTGSESASAFGGSKPHPKPSPTSTPLPTPTSAPSPTQTPAPIPTLTPKVSLSPSGNTFWASSTPIQFKATVTGTSNTAVTWSLSYALGSISQTGLYSPPSVQSSYNTVEIIATSAANPAIQARATVSLAPYSGPAPSPTAQPSPVPSPTPSAPPSPSPKPSVIPTPAPTPSPLPPTTPPGQAQRPSYSKGEGFFVLNGKLYDANGKEFRMRGVNKVHWDNQSLGLNNANSSATRWTLDFRRDANQNVALLRGDTGSGGTIAHKNVVIPGNWDGTCKEDTGVFNNIVNTWVAQIPSFKTIEKYMILNIANEWGPGNGSTVWRDSYISAIAKIRAAGWHGTISVTSGGCGQDANDLLLYAKDVFNSDPEKNIIFDQHVYGNFQDTAAGAPGYSKDLPEIPEHFAKLGALGVPVVIGEFGPGRNIGPSNTNITPTRVMQLAEQNGLGWLAWAWDDNDQDGGMSSDGWFGMSYSGSYNSSSDLTIFGRAVVEGNPGLKATSKPASIFQ
jgi:hypothetical protein